MTLKIASLLALIGTTVSFTMWQLFNWGVFDFDFQQESGQNAYKVFTLVTSSISNIPLLVFFAVIYANAARR